MKDRNKIQKDLDGPEHWAANKRMKWTCMSAKFYTQEVKKKQTHCYKVGDTWSVSKTDLGTVAAKQAYAILGFINRSTVSKSYEVH